MKTILKWSAWWLLGAAVLDALVSLLPNNGITPDYYSNSPSVPAANCGSLAFPTAAGRTLHQCQVQFHTIEMYMFWVFSPIGLVLTGLIFGALFLVVVAVVAGGGGGGGDVWHGSASRGMFGGWNIRLWK